ncbi:MAG: DarT ssDNA thymidine ADP-ribosyltransferase family protein [Candidatus Sericytochromatia bacterium]
MSLSPDALHIQTRLAQEGIENLWHFTSIKNLPLIKGRGLYSKQKLETEELFSQVITGGNQESIEADRQRGNWNLVSLAYTPSTPMFYHTKQANHLVYWEIDPAVACFEGVIFTNKNALKKLNGTTRKPGIAGLNEVQFNYFKPNQTFSKDWREFVQAEVLIPEMVSPDYLKALYTVSPISKLYAEISFEEAFEKIIVQPNIFKDNFGQQFAFPFVNRMKYMTDDGIKDLNADSFCWAQGSAPYWPVNQNMRVGFEVHATLGARLRVYLERELMLDHTFQSSGMQTCPKVLQLNRQQGTLRVFINKICWLKCEVK